MKIIFLKESSETWTQLKYGRNRNLKCFMSTTAFLMELSVIVVSRFCPALPTENRLSYLLYVTQGLTKYPASKGAQ